MKINWRMVAMLFAAAMTYPAVAGDGSSVPMQVTVVNGVTLFTTSNHTNAPSCASTNRWAFDASTGAGQAMMSVVMTAYALQKTLGIHGTGDCNTWGDSESVAFVVIN